jgi:hypothetical protein
MKVQEALNAAFEALLPFADCLQYIEIDEDDEEWAKFRLLIKHYRQAAVAYEKCKSALTDMEKCEPVLKVYQGEICYKSQADEQSYGMWCPVNFDTAHTFKEGTEFYTSPISKEFIGLSDDEIQEIAEEVYKTGGWDLDYGKAIEAKLKQLNAPEKG